MDSPQVRRPRSVIESISSSNVQSDDGQWLTMEWRRFMWVTMQPTTRGAHKVSKRHACSRTHHWKGRILEFKQGRDGKQLAKVQHVYMASQLTLNNSCLRRFPTNYIFPSDFVEWEPIASFTGIFNAFHADLGKLMYSGCLASELLAQEVFFYENTYIVPKRNSCGHLVPIQTPTLASMDWPTPDNVTVCSIRRRIMADVQAAMKCTYGSHRATVAWLVPLHVFVFFFNSQEVHRTPTMWVCKGAAAQNIFLPAGWDTKVVQHQGDTIKCTVVSDKVVTRYHIGRQMLTMVFPYRRWRKTFNMWEALDSDVIARDVVELQIFLPNDIVQDITVNDDWHLGNLHEYLVLRFQLEKPFSYVINQKAVRQCKEKSLLCKDIESQCIFVKIS